MGGVKASLFASAVLIVLPAKAQAQAATSAPDAPAATQAQTGQTADADIVVTATGRVSKLSDIPIAVTALSSQQLELTGASDIQQIAQLVPSLAVPTGVTEVLSSARIRGVGTSGTNVGFEASVSTFVDGVYRSRAGVALTELGPIQRVEVLRGPQGTLFGRNASAGLLNVVTQGPTADLEGYAKLELGNYESRRIEGGVSGPLGSGFSARADGVFFRRDGYVYDVAGQRDFNNRDRYVLRGQLSYESDNRFSARLIADYTRRTEQFGATIFAPPTGYTRDATGTIVSNVSPIFIIEQALGAQIQPTGASGDRTSVSPTRGYGGDVRDRGLSAELRYKIGDVELTSISAYRTFDYSSISDSDYNALDITYYPALGHSIDAFTQELRAQGRTGPLDWLIGGFYLNETIDVFQQQALGTDADRYYNCVVTLAARPTTLNTALPSCSTAAASVFPGYVALAASLGTTSLPGTRYDDRLRQKTKSWALFTHNIVNITDALSLTLGLRYTHEDKDLAASLSTTAPLCSAIRTSGQAIAAAVTANACTYDPRLNGRYADNKSEGQWTGTAVLSYRPTPELMTYGSYSRGYKAGGYNLDRTPFVAASPNAAQLRFDAETVNAYEIGAKYNLGRFNLAIAAFRELFSGFQLLSFNGATFSVSNVLGCKDDLGGGDLDGSPTTGRCTGGKRAGVVSQGVEIEGGFRPMRTLSLNGSVLFNSAEFRRNLISADGSPLGTTLFQLPGRQLTNAPRFVATASAAYTPAITDTLTGLIYLDARHSSTENTGSDLALEKQQDGYTLFNGRIGIRSQDDAWALELWATNLTDRRYYTLLASAPRQGSGSLIGIQRGINTSATTLYEGLIGTPRVYGLTLKSKF